MYTVIHTIISPMLNLFSYGEDEEDSKSDFKLICSGNITFRESIPSNVKEVKDESGSVSSSAPTSLFAAVPEVKKSKKLLCSQVKIGSEVKQIVSGIKKYYSAEEMVGKKVMVLVNLKPAKLAGVLSEGMLLCAEDAEGNLALMTPEKAMPAGAEIC